MEGYKTEQFVDKIDENFLCPICNDVFRDPVHCKEGHTFCRYCIEQWMRSVCKCPMDNSVIKDKNFTRNLALRGYIDNLKVYCHPKGTTENNNSTVASAESKNVEQCTWVGKLQNLSKHQKTCPFQYIKCSHDNCIVRLQRREIKEHEDKCKYKIVACDKCQAILVRHEIDRHKKDDCPEELMPCPNGCTGVKGLIQNVKRMDLKNHLSIDCGKALVDCPFKKHGCQARMERQDVHIHIQENMATHMKLLENHNEKLKDELYEVKRKSLYRPDESYLWKIYDYSSLAKNKTKGTSFTSPLFIQCGHRWMLEVYPNGSNISGFGMVLVRLYWIGQEKDKQNHNSKVSAVVKLEVLSIKPESKAHHCVTKNIAFTKTNDYWEWDRFMRSDVVLSGTFCDSSTGILQMKCSIQLNDTD